MSKKSFIGFGRAIEEALRTVLPSRAKNALKIQNLTETEIVNGTTKADVGLGDVENLGTKKTYTTGETLLSNLYVVPKVIRGIVDYFITPLQGTTGKVVFSKSSTQMDVETDFPIHDVGVCTGPGERDACLAAKVLLVVYERNEHRLWTLSGGLYTEQPKSSIINHIKPNRWFVNRQTGKLFYARTATMMVSF